MSTANKENADARRRIKAICELLVSGQCGYIEASRAILPLANAVGMDKDLEVFVLIESETDHIPFGYVRKNWSVAALAKMKPDWDEDEKWAEGVGKPAVGRILSWYIE